jgi:multidrug efflux pump
MSEGMKPREAYAFAASRMSGPVVAATLTRIAAFSPLLFWPGIVGQFMGYLPLTLIATLSASLVAALIFTPTLGALVGKPHEVHHDSTRKDGLYMKTVRLAIRNPGITILLAFAMLIGVPILYGQVGKGVEFFPDVEPDVGIVLVHARGNLSLAEKDRLVRTVEGRILDMPELSTIYASSGGGGSQGGSTDVTEDVVGQIQFEFVDWRQRRPAGEIMDEIREITADIPGIKVEVTAPSGGPPTGKPVQIQLASDYPAALRQAALQISGELAKRPEIKDLDNGLPIPGIDWRLEINKPEAARYGIGVGSVGSVVQLVTNGLKITEYRPQTSDKPVDIILRVPQDRRTLSQIDDLEIQTAAGSVPIGNFIERVPAQRTGIINRVDGRQVITITANVAEGVQNAEVLAEIETQLGATDFGGLVSWKLAGEDEESAAAQSFLMSAFTAAIFLIFAVLLAQFNKLSSVALVLFSIVLSTIGVFLGLIIMGQPFGIVMTGVGIIALAGIVTNNNIVLIDTYDKLRKEGVPVEEAILRTCRERARPVLLTAGAAVLGVLPIAFGININFVHQEILMGAPSTQWWIQLSTAIVFGLSFATILTLIVTPAQLAFVAKMGGWWARLRQRMRRSPAAGGGAAPAHARGNEDQVQF